MADFSASKRFYLEHGLEVAKSVVRTYVEFAAPSKHIKLGLYKRRAPATWCACMRRLRVSDGSEPASSSCTNAVRNRPRCGGDAGGRDPEPAQHFGSRCRRSEAIDRHRDVGKTTPTLRDAGLDRDHRHTMR